MQATTNVNTMQNNKSKSTSVLPKQRSQVLEEAKNLKMAKSAHAYVRGNTKQFYEWLGKLQPDTLPKGPAVWICGDCHLGNLGPVANLQGGVEIQIRDLDQTVIGNPAHDLIRLALSLSMAARSSNLPGITTAVMMEKMMEGYIRAFDRISVDSGKKRRPISFPQVITPIMTSALNRSWRHLARERLEDPSPRIPIGRRFWKLTAEEKDAIEAMFQIRAVSGLATMLSSREDEASVHIRDAAYWLKGCSSLGRIRYAVVLSVGGGNGRKAEYCLMDIKEAAQASAPWYGSSKMPKDPADRVLEGARHLSPHLGERMRATNLLGRPVIVRELMPQDMKLEFSHLNWKDSSEVAEFLANVVGKAHARQMDEKTAASWQKELGRNRSKTLDAPSWLWSSVVDLVASHEAGYLQHCRRYASRFA
jgi:uncharacterized protein (DUF2252 family)